MQAETLIAYSL